MKKTFIAAAVLSLVSAASFAAQGDILTRVRVINVAPADSTDGALSTLNVGANSATTGELDFTYMITNNIGAELILGTTRHEVTSSLGSLGKVSVLPPTVTVQYHFTPDSFFRPYVGAGLNYTRFYNNDLKVGNQGLSIDNNSFGGALQIGADFAVSKNVFINVDVKKLWIKTDVSLNGTDLGTLKIDPWVFGFGVGTKF
ncbi:OmpW/AlkL family protein [Iodobacter fluviatilis]|uniref:Outer membrane protein n=1 Tax=Iodobacter fluviatilis TaxID=537 RepID=A0A377Q2N8_9NEIS|nr:OmpW family outer membrane protein [Iodobacter fluviatilis]TCU90018.1 outer membrane protein [Iodobacter fluviatilis]STQ89045.1 Outer membrane protein W precursor [Iodobacter fluviatilis]